MDPLRRGGDRRGAGSAVLFQHQRLPAGGSGQHHYQSFSGSLHLRIRLVHRQAELL